MIPRGYLYYKMNIEKYEKTIYELKQLLEVTKVLNSTLHFKKLVDSILFSFMAQARCIKAALYIGKEIEPEIITLQRNYMGFDMIPSIPVQLNCNTTSMKKVASEARCITNTEFQDIISDLHPDLDSYVTNELELIIPLIVNKHLVGLIFLGGRIDSEPVTRGEMDFLTEIGIYSSIAIQNAILFDMSTMDMMTELKVKHYITKFMDDCISSGDHNFVVLMMDIDDFKSVNDTYGHQTGDNTIIGVAGVIKNIVRSHDIAARYGGEEFVIMLRDTELDDAAIVAERIRLGVEALDIDTGDKPLKVTISIGVAEFDSDLDRKSGDVIGRADDSLYISKKRGKNRITTA